MKPEKQPAARHDDDFIRHWSQELSDSIPPVSEIARLAALLAQGKSLGSRDFADMARQAIELWNACDKERKHWITKCGLWELARAQDSWRSTTGKLPKTWPVSLDDFLKFALPKKRPEDRMKIYRESIREKLRHDRRVARSPSNATLISMNEIPRPTDDECNEVIAQDRATKFNEFHFQPRLIELRQFAAWYEKQNLKNRGKVAGLKSAAVRKGKKEAKKAATVKKIKKTL